MTLENPAPSKWQCIKLISTGALKEWVDQRASSKGAALAFYTLFSMAPVLVLVIAIAGSIFGRQAAQGEIFSQLKELLGPQGAEAVQALLINAGNQDSGRIAAIIASLFLIAGATTVFSELKSTLDEMWKTEEPAPGGLLSLVLTRVLSFSLVLAIAFLLLVSLAVSAALTVLERYWNGLWADAVFILTPVSSVISFALVTCLFAVIYKLLPRVRLSWRDVWTGSAFTAALFTLGKYAIGIYLGNSAVANSYGAAGSLVAVLLWVYYSAQIFFFGALVTREYALRLGSLAHSHSR